MEAFMLNIHMQRSTLLDTFYENLQATAKAETPHLMALLKAFKLSASNPTAILEGFCVLSYTEEIQGRAFPSWMTVYVNVPPPAAAATPSADLVVEEDFPDKWNTEVSELNINMLKWGRQLSEMDKTEHQNKVVVMTTEFSNLGS